MLSWLLLFSDALQGLWVALIMHSTDFCQGGRSEIVQAEELQQLCLGFVQQLILCNMTVGDDACSLVI